MVGHNMASAARMEKTGKRSVQNPDRLPGHCHHFPSRAKPYLRHDVQTRGMRENVRREAEGMEEVGA